MELNNPVTVDFTYLDELGESTRLVKTVANDYLGGTQLDVLCDLFCDFLKACGFSIAEGKRIKFVADDR